MANPTGVARSNASGILMTMYRTDKVHTAINNRVPVTQRMKQRRFTTDEGQNFLVNRLEAYSDGGGDRAEWNRIPEPRSDVHRWLTFNMARYDRTVRLSGEIMTSGGTVVDPLSSSMEKAIKAAALDAERAVFLSYSGELATVVTTTSATVLKVSTYQYLRPDMYVDVLIASSGAIADGAENVKISAVSNNADGTASITLASPGLNVYGNVSTTYSIYRTSGYRKNFHGLPDIVSDTDPTGKDYAGIDRDAVPTHKALITDAEGASISGAVIAQAMTKIEVEGNGEKPTVCWIHPYVHNDLIQIARRDARFPGSVRSFEQWGDTVFVNNVPVLRSRFCQFDKAYLLHEPNFLWAHPKKMPQGKWRQSGQNSGTVLLPVPGYWGWEALWVWRKQLVCVECNGQARIDNIDWAIGGTV